MAVKYYGITFASPAAFTADQTIFGYDVVVTGDAATLRIVGANGVAMAALAVGVPFHFGGTDPVSGEPIKLSDYSATGTGNVFVSYAVRVPQT